MPSVKFNQGINSKTKLRNTAHESPQLIKIKSEIVAKKKLNKSKRFQKPRLTCQASLEHWSAPWASRKAD